MADVPDSLWLFGTMNVLLVFFIPGFVSIKVYDLIIPKEKRDFSKDVYEAIGYSFVNFFIISLLLERELIPYGNGEVKLILKYVILLFLLPALLTLCYIYFIGKANIKLKTLRLRGDINPRPWETVFRNKEPYYLKIHLKNGETIAGIYDENSCASMYPNPEQIFLEAVVILDEDGFPQELVNGSKGILILGSEIVSIEFLERYTVEEEDR